MEPHRGKDSQGRNKFGCFSIFLPLLVCFCRRSLRMRWERPTGLPPSARWRAHAPRQPGRRATNPGSANLRIYPRHAGQTTWEAFRAPAPAFLQIPSPPPCFKEGAHVTPRSRSAPFPPPGLLWSLTPPAPPPQHGGGPKTHPVSGSGAEAVRRRKGKGGGGWT